MFRLARDERGIAFIVALFAMLVIMLTGMAFVSMATTELRIANNNKNLQAAFNLAEAGLDRVISILSEDPSWRETGELQGVGLGDGKYSVELEELGSGRIRVVSRGEVGHARKRVEAVLRQLVSPVFNYAIYVGKGEMVFKGKADLTGNVHVNGDVVNKAEVTLNGVLTYTGEFEDKRGRFNGTVQQGEEVPPPDISLEWYRANADRVIDGDYTLSGVNVFDGEILFIGGDLRIEHNTLIEGRVTIAVLGDVKVQGKLVYAEEDPENSDKSLLLVLAWGDIEILGGQQVHGWFYSVDEIEIGGNTKLYGGVAAGRVDYDGQLELRYDPQVVNEPLAGTPEYRVTLEEWGEL